MEILQKPCNIDSLESIYTSNKSNKLNATCERAAIWKMTEKYQRLLNFEIAIIIHNDKSKIYITLIYRYLSKKKINGVKYCRLQVVDNNKLLCV